MRNLSIDIETRSSADISKTGSYRYAQDPDFKIILFAYAFDDDDVQIVDLEQGEEIPAEVITALSDPTVIKHAYNAAFEWWCLNTSGYATPLDQWQCTMIHGLYCGFTAGLDATGKAVGLPQDKQKLTTGKALIRYFCVPRKPTKTDARKWNLPHHAPEKWNLFKDYCVQDVVTEREIWRRVRNYPVPESEWHLWHMDVQMNAYGVRVDEALVTGALDVNERSTVKLTNEAVSITGLANPNSPAQLLAWINSKGVEMTALDKEAVKDALAGNLPDDVRRILEIRQRLGKTSIKKYTVMQVAEGPDHRVRGVSQFYGANRTGRWAGRLLQLQNCTKNHIDTIDFARKLVSERNLEGIELIYGDVQDLLSQLVRTALIPSEGNHFVVADFSAIEARVIGWLGGEDWVNEEFAGEGKIYEATAAQMFGVPKEKIKKGNPEYALRQKGKVATLALGYQGGTSALTAMGALKMGIPEDELPDIVEKWRNANPHICKLWYDMDKALHKVMQTAQHVTVNCLTISLEGDMEYGQCFLTIQLPTGRKLYYPKPHMKENRFGRQALHYFTQGQITRKWEVTSTYGGKVTENCLAGDTPVLTDRGWVPISFIRDDDKVWDGHEWVSHSGLDYKGEQRVISIDGVICTPEHRILTKEGWKNASSCKGLDRYEVRLPNSNFICGLGWEKIDLEHLVRLWKAIQDACLRVYKARTEILRLQEELSYLQEGFEAWYVGETVLERVALHEREMRMPNSTSLEKLRGPWNKSMREVVEQLRSILRGHVPRICERANTGQDRCERRLLPRKLPLDYSKRAEQEQKKQCFHKHSLGQNDCGGGIRKIWDRKDNSVLQNSERGARGFDVYETERTEQVYDIINAGPRHRFTVLSSKGPVLVHNCVQAIARDCLAEVLLRIERKGWKPVFHVHDEVIVDVPMDVTSDDLCDLMAEPIPWAPGLVLRGAGFESMYYMKD